MCRVCVEFELGKLTIEEATRNFSELNDDGDLNHLEKFFKLIENEIFNEIK